MILSRQRSFIAQSVHYQWYKHFFTIVLIVLVLYTSMHVSETNFTELLANTDQMGAFLQKLIHPDFSYVPSLIDPLIRTFQMSVQATTVGVLLAIPLAFLATTVATQNGIVSGIVRFLLNVIRTIPNTLLAAILVSMIGIGEGTGTLTLTIFTAGMVSQLLYEAIETIDRLPLEAAESVGANKLKTAVWAIWPQIIRPVLSYSFYALEVNIRSSTVLGYVGAGGIGIILNSSLALFKYDRVSIILIAIFLMVVLVDALSEYFRRKLA